MKESNPRAESNTSPSPFPVDGDGVFSWGKWGRSLWVWVIFFGVVATGVAIRDSRILSNPDRFKTYREKWSIRGDFTTFSLAAAYAVRRGENPYERENVVVFPEDVYPSSAFESSKPHKAPWNCQPGKNFKYFPLNAVVLLPFTFLPVPVAQGVWFALNLTVLIGILYAHKGLAGEKRIRPFVWIGAFVLAARFFQDNLNLGQWNLPVYNLTILGLYLTIVRRMPWRGGLLVGLAAGLKFMPAGFALYFLARRQWRAAAAIGLSIVFWVLLVPSLVLGPTRHWNLLHEYRLQTKRQMENRVDSGGVTGHSLLVTLKAYLTPVERKGEKDDTRYRINILNLERATADWAAKTFCLTLVAVTWFACTRGGAGATPGRRTMIELGLWFTLYLLISPEVRRAQMLTVFTAGMALMLTWAETRVASRVRWTSLAAVGVAIAMVAISSRIREGYWREWVILHGGLTLGIGSLWAMLLALRFRQDEKTGDRIPDERSIGSVSE